MTQIYIYQKIFRKTLKDAHPGAPRYVSAKLIKLLKKSYGYPFYYKSRPFSLQRKWERIKDLILISSHINQSPLNCSPIVFAIQHNDILIEIYILKISNGLEGPDDICPRKFTLIHSQHGIERETGGEESDVDEIL